ncbi:MAG: hypothetical protein ACPG7F_00475 [Aggregatilineales bacterium]
MASTRKRKNNRKSAGRVPAQLKHWMGVVDPFKEFAVGLGDWGNFNWKTMLLSVENQEHPDICVARNQILYPTDSQWLQYQTTYRAMPAQFKNTQMFQYHSRTDKKWHNVIAGDAAVHFGSPKTMTGNAKYTYDYWGVVAMSQLLTLFPKGVYEDDSKTPKKIVLGVGFPVGAAGSLDVMQRTILGKHYVKTFDGQKIVFDVVEVLPWVEQTGSIVHFLSNAALQYNAHELDEGDVILVVDMGGGETSLTQVLVQRDAHDLIELMPVYDQDSSPTFDSGINNCADRLRQDLRINHPDFATAKVNKISYRVLMSALRDRRIKIQGEPVDIPNEVNRAIYQEMDAIASLYNNNLNSGNGISLVLITAGGGDTLYDDIADKDCINHRNIAPAGIKGSLVFSNIKGAETIMDGWVQRKMDEVARYG